MTQSLLVSLVKTTLVQLLSSWTLPPAHMCHIAGPAHRPKGGVHLPSLAAQHRLLCATVGGESVCLVDVETGRVEMKYKEPGEVSRLDSRTPALLARPIPVPLPVHAALFRSSGAAPGAHWTSLGDVPMS